MQLVVAAPGKLEWRDPAAPTLRTEEDAIVRPIAVARCDLDLALVQGNLGTPIEIGHEFVAEVIEVGAAVRKVQPGDRVVSSFNVSCGRCQPCRRHAYQACGQVEKPAMYGFGAYGHNWGGVVTERVRIPYADEMLLPLPPNVSAVAAASAGDNLADAYRSIVPPLAKAPGSRVLVMGGGSISIGLYGVAWACRAGAEAVDYFDTDPSRLALAEKLGGRALEAEAPPASRTYDVALNASGRAEALGQIMPALGHGAIVTSSYTAASEVTLPYMQAFSTGVTLVIGDQNTRAHMPAVLAALAEGFDPTSEIATVVDWRDAAEAFTLPCAKLVLSRDPAD